MVLERFSWRIGRDLAGFCFFRPETQISRKRPFGSSITTFVVTLYHDT